MLSAGSIVGVGSAKIANVGIRTAAQFDLLTASDILLHVNGAAARSVPASNLLAGDISTLLQPSGTRRRSSSRKPTEAR